MANRHCDYLIIGTGLAGASAVEGIRELDRDRSITMIGAENHLPYDRPPLTKKLWFGKKKVEDIFLHDRDFYDRAGVTLLTGRRVVALDAGTRTLRDSQGEIHAFAKLLLATGGMPRVLDIPGGTLDGICYYRFLDDYQRMRQEATAGKSALIVGGGFIGSEMAAALCVNKLNVTMVYPSTYLCGRVFPQELALALEHHFQSRGIRILKGQKPVSIAQSDSRFVTRTSGGETIESDLLIVGIGIEPAVELAGQDRLVLDAGIRVNEYLQTSHPDIYAAGDNARFPYRARGPLVRVEHWDNALSQGKQAGRNMAGAKQAYDYMPYFFSDLFEFGYEAVGEVNSSLEVFADWQKQNEKGVIYYLKGGTVRGVMMCDVWDKVPAARALIEEGSITTPEKLRGAIA